MHLYLGMSTLSQQPLCLCQHPCRGLLWRLRPLSSHQLPVAQQPVRLHQLPQQHWPQHERLLLLRWLRQGHRHPEVLPGSSYHVLQLLLQSVASAPTAAPLASSCPRMKPATVAMWR